MSIPLQQTPFMSDAGNWFGWKTGLGSSLVAAGTALVVFTLGVAVGCVVGRYVAGRNAGPAVVLHNATFHGGRM